MLALMLCSIPAAAQDGAAIVAPPADTFAATVDLSPLTTVAVFNQGRLKSYESFAREIMQQISGGREISGRPATFTYLDLMLRPERYQGQAFVFVKMKLMRTQIAQALEASMMETGAPEGVQYDLRKQMASFIDTGLIAPEAFDDPRVIALMQHLRADVLRTAPKVEAIEAALSLRDPGVLRQTFAVIPPLPDPERPASGRPWRTADEIFMQAQSTQTPPADLETAALRAWAEVSEAWARGDAAAVNQALPTYAAALEAVNPALYPEDTRLSWESWYFRAKNMTWVWLLYALAIVLLVLHVAFRWQPALHLGWGMFIIAFGFHTFAVGLRWYVSGRWPNSNMFEAITTAAWFGGCFAILSELFLRNTSARGLISLGSAVASMVALMAVHFLPLQLNAGINNMMPVLNDVWLYIHTNVIIFSYVLIFMAAISAGLYLLHRVGLMMFSGAGRQHRIAQYARVGGAASLIQTAPDGSQYLSPARTTLGQVLDGVTMILMELSFVLLWAGLVMGAIWADHSWGRPWGWDPKEVFALNTFIVFAVLVHVRLKVRDKGLWTALIAMVGCAVMLFNWIIINFTISGLHSYA